MTTELAFENSFEMNRREAIKRASLLLGAAISSSTLAGALNAQSPGGSAGSGPKRLKATQFEIVKALAERILPKTDTPGAIDAGVPEFIDAMHGGYMTDLEMNVFAQGLASVNKSSRADYGSPFTKLAPEQQDTVLRELAKASEGKSDTFLHKMRELTLTGYFTSELVMKNVLNYDFIPGMYKGCIPISETGNVVWAHK